MVTPRADRTHLTVDDSFWTWLETPETSMHVAALAIFAPTDEPAAKVARRIVTQFREHTDLQPRFRSVIAPRRFPRRGRVTHIDDVDVDFHLRHNALPEPGGERELAQLISRLHSIPLDARRPMWEIHVIEGLHGNRFAVYLKVHHSLINGVEAVRLFGRSLATDPHAPIGPPIWALPRPPRAARAPRGRTPRRRRLATLTTALRSVDQLRRARRTTSALVGPFEAPLSPLNVEVGPQRRISTASVDLDWIKGLAASTGTSVNDIVLNACAAALRRYLLDIEGLPEQPLIVGCPVSIPAPDGSSGDSSVGIMFATLATDESDPRQRLSAIVRSTSAAKQHQATLPHDALVPYSVLAMAPHTVRQLVPGAVRHVPPMFNLIMSNVPGPSQRLYLAGAPMVGLYPLSLLFQGEALNITAVSYDGRIHFGFTACRTALPRVQRIALYLEEAFGELDRHDEAPTPAAPPNE